MSPDYSALTAQQTTMPNTNTIKHTYTKTVETTLEVFLRPHSYPNTGVVLAETDEASSAGTALVNITPEGLKIRNDSPAQVASKGGFPVITNLRDVIYSQAEVEDIPPGLRREIKAELQDDLKKAENEIADLKRELALAKSARDAHEAANVFALKELEALKKTTATTIPGGARLDLTETEAVTLGRLLNCHIVGQPDPGKPRRTLDEIAARLHAWACRNGHSKIIDQRLEGRDHGFDGKAANLWVGS